MSLRTLVFSQVQASPEGDDDATAGSAESEPLLRDRTDQPGPYTGVV